MSTRRSLGGGAAGEALRALMVIGLAGCGRIGFGDVAGVDDGGGMDVATDTCGYLFCNGFEETADETPWDSPITVGGSTARVTAPVHSGAFAGIHMVTVPNGRAFDLAPVWSAQTTGDVFIRAYFYLPSGVVINHVDILAVASTSDFTALPEHIGILTNDLVGFGHDLSGQVYLGSAVPRDRWFCFEVHIALSATAGTLEQFIDGNLDLSVPDIPTVAAGISHLAVGAFFAMDAGLTMYVDDVLVSSVRIGC